MNPEVAFAEWALAQGWTVTKRGWPDFICRRNGELMVVEVKGPRDGLSRQQWDTINDLRRAGIPTFVWGPDTGFVELGAMMGESVHSLKATIADLQRRIAELQNPTPLATDDTVIEWAPILDDSDSLAAVGRECTRSHPEHRQHEQTTGLKPFCSQLALLGLQYPVEVIGERIGLPAARIARLLARATAYLTMYQHKQVHIGLVGTRRCTGCADQSDAA